METTITLNGHTYTAALSRGPEDSRTSVSICRDDAWAGNGFLRYTGDGIYAIEDCAANLGDEVYEALEEAIGDEFSRGVGAEVDPA